MASVDGVDLDHRPASGRSRAWRRLVAARRQQLAARAPSNVVRRDAQPNAVLLQSASATTEAHHFARTEGCHEDRVAIGRNFNAVRRRQLCSGNDPDLAARMPLMNGSVDHSLPHLREGLLLRQTAIEELRRHEAPVGQYRHAVRRDILRQHHATNPCDGRRRGIGIDLEDLDGFAGAVTGDIQAMAPGLLLTQCQSMRGKILRIQRAGAAAKQVAVVAERGSGSRKCLAPGLFTVINQVQATIGGLRSGEAAIHPRGDEPATGPETHDVLGILWPADELQRSIRFASRERSAGGSRCRCAPLLPASASSAPYAIRAKTSAAHGSFDSIRLVGQRHAKLDAASASPPW